MINGLKQETGSCKEPVSWVNITGQRGTCTHANFLPLEHPLVNRPPPLD